MEQVNINDTLDIVLVKLGLTISEREEVESLFDFLHEESISSFEEKLKSILEEQQADEIISWMKLNNY